MTYKILLAGNPNVGKSTVFNALTGMKQHTGNWSGKTVETAAGYYKHNNNYYNIIDLPGTTSLCTDSRDERAALNAILKTDYQCIVIVADACALQKNLYLIIQILEFCNNAVLCLNMAEQAKKQNIIINKDILSKELGIPVVMTEARKKHGLEELKDTISSAVQGEIKSSSFELHYDDYTEKHIEEISSLLSDKDKKRGTAIHMIENTSGKENDIYSYSEDISRKIAAERIRFSEEVYKKSVQTGNTNYNKKRITADKIICSRFPGILIMLLLFAFIIFLTIIGANYPSEWLSFLFSELGKNFRNILENTNIPDNVISFIVDGVYLTLTTVISVMLPPMAIFFPLFTILEDLGYLPRVAFILDNFFKKSGTNGKQGLTTLMGFGCNSCGITGCRIIGCDRQRSIAILTNNFVPCNGRFPTLICIVSIFFVGSFPFVTRSFISSLFLTAIIIFSIMISLSVSKLLSVTLFKTKNSSFILELPEYRIPQIGKTLIRSVIDKTAVVLGRAVIVAAPAGAVIWLLTNIHIYDKPLTDYITSFLAPAAQLMGLDGVILTAFILGFPANEIVLPIILMLYTSNSIIEETGSFTQIFDILSANGWNIKTALCTVLFTLMHFPCSTSCITVKKETGSMKMCILAFIIPTICGIICCVLANIIMSLIGF